MSKLDKLASVLKNDQQIASRIRHLFESHHSEALQKSIDRDFIESIESKRDANAQYYRRMRSLKVDELDAGLEQYNKLKQMALIQKENFQKDYRERVNGVLGQLEKSIANRRKMFMSELCKQQEKEKRFVDEIAIKERKISQHVNLNYDQNVFYHESDRYQKHQNKEQAETLKIVQLQKGQSQRKRKEQKNLKEIQSQIRKDYEELLKCSVFAEKQKKMKGQEKYHLELKKMIQDKRNINEDLIKTLTDKKKHNPITNPIEYHIDNPYILRRLSKYQ